MKMKKKILFFYKIKEEKLEFGEPFVIFCKSNLYLYEENFDADIYINVIKEAMLEIKDFGGE